MTKVYLSGTSVLKNKLTPLRCHMPTVYYNFTIMDVSMTIGADV